MKTRYFSTENITTESENLLQRLPDSIRRQLSNFIPSKSVLLILDMQSYFLEPSSHAFIPSAQAIVPGLKTLAQAYFSNNLPVIFTQHLNTPQDAGLMATWWQELVKIEDPLSAIIPAFNFSNRFVMRKSQYDAFYKTSLEDLLYTRGVSQVIVTGVMTHLCCETTARSAFVRGFEVFFVVDGTATYNEDHHLATLRNLAHGFATLVLMTDMLDTVKSTSVN